MSNESYQACSNTVWFKAQIKQQGTSESQVKLIWGQIIVENYFVWIEFESLLYIYNYMGFAFILGIRTNHDLFSNNSFTTTRNSLNINGITDGIIMSVICSHNYRQNLFHI